MTLTPSDPQLLSGSALVLGGGGSTGNAWLIGVIAGLCDAGLDVTAADLIIGTSAGSTAAAQISGAALPELYAAALAAPATRASTSGTGTGTPTPRSPSRGRPVADHLDRMRAMIAAASDAADYRHRVGAAALDRGAAADGSWQAQWRATVASRLPRQDWPERRLAITAVNATTAEPVVFHRDSGVDLADAVAASCASAFPYRIGDAACIDGGYRSNADNADLAAGFATVLVLSPLSGRSMTPVEWGVHLESQVEQLRAQGSRVETIFPPRDAEHMFGANAMDLSLRPAAARCGYEQGGARAEELAGFWDNLT
jgi:NTE family protein